MLTRIIGELTEELLNDFAKDVQSIEEGDSEVEILLHSVGGDMEIMKGFIDLIESMKRGGITVKTIGIGRVSSAVIPILMSGTRRLCGAETIFYIHQPEQSTNNLNKHEVILWTDKYKRNEQYYRELLSKYGARLDDIVFMKALNDGLDQIFYGKEALYLGIVDEVVP